MTTRVVGDFVPELDQLFELVGSARLFGVLGNDEEGERDGNGLREFNEAPERNLIDERLRLCPQAMDRRVVVQLVEVDGDGGDLQAASSSKKKLLTAEITVATSFSVSSGNSGKLSTSVQARRVFGRLPLLECPTSAACFDNGVS